LLYWLGACSTAELEAEAYNFDHCDPLASNKRLESRSKSEAK